MTDQELIDEFTALKVNFATEVAHQRRQSSLSSPEIRQFANEQRLTNLEDTMAKLLELIYVDVPGDLDGPETRTEG